MARDQPTARGKPTDPQPTGKSKDGRSLTSNVTPLLSKGKPYLWFATHPWLATKWTADPLPRGKGKDKLSLTSNVTPTPMKLKK